MAIGLTVPELLVTALILAHHKAAPGPEAPVMLAGAVLKQSLDPIKRTPLAGVSVSARSGAVMMSTKSDASGRFQLEWRGRGRNAAPVVLRFEGPGYKSLEMTASPPGDQLYLARMEALEPEKRPDPSAPSAAPMKLVEIKDVRVRYSYKDQSTVPVGSLAKQFPVPNTGNVPCNGGSPCSPDGRWKAVHAEMPLDVEDGNELRNVRVSCIAGPCPFTRIDTASFAAPARKMTISVLNWSDETVFLIEADITRTMVADRVRESYPFIVDEAMSFALPPTAQGLSVQAEVNKESIVYPLGPPLLLSWAACSMQAGQDSTQIYRCILKPGYRFAP